MSSAHSGERIDVVHVWLWSGLASTASEPPHHRWHRRAFVLVSAISRSFCPCRAGVCHPFPLASSFRPARSMRVCRAAHAWADRPYRGRSRRDHHHSDLDAQSCHRQRHGVGDTAGCALDAHLAPSVPAGVQHANSRHLLRHVQADIAGHRPSPVVPNHRATAPGSRHYRSARSAPRLPHVHRWDTDSR